MPEAVCRRPLCSNTAPGTPLQCLGTGRVLIERVHSRGAVVAAARVLIKRIGSSGGVVAARVGKQCLDPEAVLLLPVVLE